MKEHFKSFSSLMFTHIPFSSFYKNVIGYKKRKGENIMSFLTQLVSGCDAYANYKYGNYSISLPYHLGGKTTPSKITENISSWAGATQKTQAEIQNYVTTHPSSTGVDCSGLVYYVLNEASGGAVRTYFEETLNLPGRLTYAYGISAANLTNTSYGTKITAANDIKPGCVIRFDNGKHVLVIHEVIREGSGNVISIGYTHSNGSKGPHYGSIAIGDPTKDLNDKMQAWHDIAYTNSTAKGYYNYTLLLNPISGLV